MIRVLTIASLSILLVSCTATTGGSTSSSSGEIEEMKRRIVELQQRAAITDVELSRLRQQIANLEAGLDSGELVETRQDTSPRQIEPIPPVADTQDDVVSRPSETIEESDLDGRQVGRSIGVHDLDGVAAFAQGHQCIHWDREDV